MKNKGFALALTVAVMTIVFAICLATVTILVCQTTLADENSLRHDRKIICNQLGDIFYDNLDDETALSASLKGIGFEFDGKQWNYSLDDTNYSVKFSSEDSNRTATIFVNNQEYLIVEIFYDGTTKTITKWKKIV